MTLKHAKSKALPPDIIMWVGSFNYTIREFIEEAQRWGVCKRVGQLLHNIVPGKTRLFLAHDQGLKGDGVIFAWCVVDRIERTVDESYEFIPTPRIYESTVAISLKTLREPERRSGWRSEPEALYLCNSIEPEDIIKLADQLKIDPEDIPGGLVLIKPPVSYAATVGGNRFRGAKMVNGSKILNAPKSARTTIAKVPKVRGHHKWRPAEDNALLTLVNQAKDKKRALHEYCLQSGRKYPAVAYRYKALLKKTKLTPEEDGYHRTHFGGR